MYAQLQISHSSALPWWYGGREGDDKPLFMEEVELSDDLPLPPIFHIFVSASLAISI